MNLCGLYSLMADGTLLSCEMFPNAKLGRPKHASHAHAKLPSYTSACPLSRSTSGRTLPMCFQTLRAFFAHLCQQVSGA